MIGTSSFTFFQDNTVRNSTHSINTFNNSHKLRVEKSAQLHVAQNYLRPDSAAYTSAYANATSYGNQKNTAIDNRDDADWEIFLCDLELTTKNTLLNQNQADRVILIQAKADLETLKTTKAQLQTLDDRVQIIINNLRTHVTTYESVSAEVTMLIVLINTLEAQKNSLTFSLAATQGNIDTLTTEVVNADGILDATTTTLDQSRSDLIAQLGRMNTVIPRDLIIPLSASG